MVSVVLLSGGVDSTVALAEMIDKGRDVRPIFVDYGQRNASQESRATVKICQHFDLERTVLSIPVIWGSALTTRLEEIPAGATVTPNRAHVPGRNLILLAHALSIAETLNGDVVIGCNADDHAGFIDCRADFFETLWALEAPPILVPHLRRTKAEVVALGRELGAPLDDTWSCYDPILVSSAFDVQPCGRCGACVSNQI